VIGTEVEPRHKPLVGEHTVHLASGFLFRMRGSTPQDRPRLRVPFVGGKSLSLVARSQGVLCCFCDGLA